jgi:hypothetical protein
LDEPHAPWKTHLFRYVDEQAFRFVEYCFALELAMIGKPVAS